MDAFRSTSCQKWTSSGIQFCALVENALNIHRQLNFGTEIEWFRRRDPRIFTNSTISQAILWNLCGELCGDIQTVQILEEIQRMLAGANVQPSQLRGWGFWLSMYNNTNGHQKHSEEICKQSETRLASCAKDCEPGRWSPPGPGDEEKLYASSIDKPQEKWNATAEIMKQDFASSGYPLSRCTSPLSKGVPLCTGGGRLTVHYNEDPTSADLLLKTSVTVNQLRI